MSSSKQRKSQKESNKLVVPTDDMKRCKLNQQMKKLSI